MNSKEYFCPFCRKSKSEKLYPTRDINGDKYFIARCLFCKCYYLIPPPTSDQLSKTYNSSYYGPGENKFGSSTERVLDYFRNRRAGIIHRYLKGKGRVLDIGCGNGRFLQFLGDKGRYELYGIERQGPAADRASQINGINLYKQDLKDCVFEPESLDAVSLFHVFEHLTEPRETLQTISKVLKKNGILYISFPNIDSIQSRLFKGNWLHLDPPRHLFFFKPMDFKRLMEKYGFELLKERHFNTEYNPFGMCQSILNCLSKRRDLLYESMKGNIQDTKGSELALHRIFFYPTFPFFIATDFIESLFGKGATVEFVFEKQGSRVPGA